MAASSTFALFDLQSPIWQRIAPIVEALPPIFAPTVDIAARRVIILGDPARGGGGMKGEAGALQHSWQNLRRPVSATVLTAAYTLLDTTISVSGGRMASFQQGDIIATNPDPIDQSQEYMLIRSIAETDATSGSFTVVRAWGGTTAEARLVNTVLTRLCASVPETQETYPAGDLQVAGTTSLPMPTTNYIQTISRREIIPATVLNDPNFRETIYPAIVTDLIGKGLNDTEAAISAGRAVTGPSGYFPQGGNNTTSGVLYGACMDGFEAVWRNNYLASTVLSLTAGTLSAFIQNGYKKSPANNLIVLGLTAADTFFSAFDYGFSYTRKHCQSDGSMEGRARTLGGSTSRSIGMANTPYGSFTFIVNRWIRPGYIFMMNLETDLQMVVAEPFAVHEVAAPNNGKQIIVRGRATLRYGDPATWHVGTTDAAA